MVACNRLRLLGLAEAAWGLVLLARGDQVWKAAGGATPGEVERVAVRLLGLRQLLQGSWRIAFPMATGRSLVVLELSHAASLVPWLKSNSRGGPVRLSIAVALLSAAVGATANRQGGKCCSRN